MQCVYNQMYFHTQSPVELYLHVHVHVHVCKLSFSPCSSLSFKSSVLGFVYNRPLYLTCDFQHTRTHARMYAHTCMHVHSHTHTRTYTHTHTHTHTDLLSPLIRNKLSLSQRSYKLWAGKPNRIATEAE